MSDAGFDGHYCEWRAKRLRTIIQYYGADRLRGMKVLELGCGYGDIGMGLWTLGADVFFSDARQEHLEVIRSRYPSLPRNRLMQIDLEKGIEPSDRFDLILHLGVLYHLTNWEKSIRDCAKVARFMVLESEVCDSDDNSFEISIQEEGYDQAFSGVGTRPSADNIEREMREAGFAVERIADSRCNSEFHVYDWPVTNSNTWRHGLRRFWFCGTDGLTRPR